MGSASPPPDRLPLAADQGIPGTRRHAFRLAAFQLRKALARRSVRSTRLKDGPRLPRYSILEAPTGSRRHGEPTYLPPGARTTPARIRVGPAFPAQRAVFAVATDGASRASLRPCECL